MPKKRSANFTKPSSTPHPSLSPPPHASTASDRAATSTTVNEILTTLRRNQISSSESPKSLGQTPIATTRTVHPSLRQILHVADTAPPRPRLGQPGRALRRGPAGPPPPTSWLTDSVHVPSHVKRRIANRRNAESEEVGRGPAAEDLVPLPGLKHVGDKTLLHQSMKAMAMIWGWQIEYNRYYLADLPHGLKSVLLHYVASYGPSQGVGIDGLRTLFPPVDSKIEEDSSTVATDGCELTHLDLSNAIGRTVTLSHLQSLFSPPIPPSNAAVSTSDSPLDSWETAIATLPTPLQTSHFPALTHLSLANPSPTVSWTKLLSLAPSLATLTHLSLAHWPVPSLTPNSKTTVLDSSSSNSRSPSSYPAPKYGATYYYSAFDGDWSEAARIIRKLSKATYCLRWIDLSGCEEWIAALMWDGTKAQYYDDDEDDETDERVDGPGQERSRRTRNGDYGVEWNTSWRSISTVVVHPSRGFRGEVNLKEIKQVAKWVQGQRNEVGGLYCRFELS
ncbi:MAG: hypothetical protein M1817_004622 [Caeruleum heppii]|nr:MAG: hypothetical protein M1817_004622 [Caeruleum heppii]